MKPKGQNKLWRDTKTIDTISPMLENMSISTDNKRIELKRTAGEDHARTPVHFVKKGWGSELWLVNDDLYCGKILRFDKGKKCSLHYHKIKTETFYLHTGRLKLRIMVTPDATEIEEFELETGQCMDIPPGLVHQMEAMEDAELFEFSTQHFEEDSYRLIKGD